MTMLNIKINSDKEEWNNYLGKCLNQNVFSTWEWGEFKRNSWSIERLIFLKGNNFVGMTQIFFKKIGPFRLGWSSSGINITDYENLKDIIEVVSAHYDLKKTLIRFNFFDEGIGGNQFYIDSVESLRPAVNSINSSYTIRFDLNQFENTPKNYSSNNRYYLNKAIKNKLNFEVSEFVAADFTRLHNEMADLKSLEHLKINEEQMQLLSDQFKGQIRVAKVSDESGEVVSTCAFMVFKKIAYYFLAGSNEKGRKLSASFLMIHKLIDYLKSEGVENFDFGGITPFKRSADGVNRFKIGFSGRIIKYVGERDLTKKSLLYYGFNILLKFKQIG